MYCGNCGKEMPEDSIYCGECGAKRIEELPPARGMAIVSFVLGLVSVILSVLSFVCGPLAIIYGLLSQTAGNKGRFSTLGILLGGAGIVVGWAIFCYGTQFLGAIG